MATNCSSKILFSFLLDQVFVSCVRALYSLAYDHFQITATPINYLKHCTYDHPQSYILAVAIVFSKKCYTQPIISFIKAYMKAFILGALVVLMIGGIALSAYSFGQRVGEGTDPSRQSQTPPTLATKPDSDVVPETENVIGSDRDEHGCIGSAGYSWCEVKQKCLRIWEEACASEDEDLDSIATTIKAKLLAKHGQSFEGMKVSVSKVEGDYTQGGSRSAEEGAGGGMWFGAKVNGTWQLVWDGNGIITCTDLADYPQFTTTLIPECWQEGTDEMVKR